jgi:hypothetical protein
MMSSRLTQNLKLSERTWATQFGCFDFDSQVRLRNFNLEFSLLPFENSSTLGKADKPRLRVFPV